MAEKEPLKIDWKVNFKYDKYFEIWGEEDKNARAKMGLQLIDWIVNGSPRSSRVPPVLSGFLRGSGSVFVGSKFIGTTPPFKGEGDPNRSHNEDKGVITVGFNTAYARRWHEDPFEPGPVSLQSGDVGFKYIEEHLKADGKALLEFYAKLIKKGTNG